MEIYLEKFQGKFSVNETTLLREANRSTNDDDKRSVCEQKWNFFKTFGIVFQKVVKVLCSLDSPNKATIQTLYAKVLFEIYDKRDEVFGNNKTYNEKWKIDFKVVAIKAVAIYWRWFHLPTLPPI